MRLHANVRTIHMRFTNFVICLENLLLVFVYLLNKCRFLSTFTFHLEFQAKIFLDLTPGHKNDFRELSEMFSSENNNI